MVQIFAQSSHFQCHWIDFDEIRIKLWKKKTSLQVWLKIITTIFRVSSFYYKFISYYLDLSRAGTKFWNKVGRNEGQLWYICRIEQDSWTASCLSIIGSRNYTRNRYRLWISNG